MEQTLEYTRHAAHAMKERMIVEEWVESTVTDPALRTSDPNDPEVERFFRRIPERGNRILRVAVNTSVAPWRVVSVFFDRSMARRAMKLNVDKEADALYLRLDDSPIVESVEVSPRRECSTITSRTKL